MTKDHPTQPDGASLELKQAIVRADIEAHVFEVLLADGWHHVKQRTFNTDLEDPPVFWFSEDDDVEISGPLTSVLATRSLPDDETAT